MVERLIKTMKHKLTVMAATNIQDWDSLLQKILFAYRCGIQASMKYSPFMVLTSRMPRFTIDNNLSGLCYVFDDQTSPEIMVNQMILNVADYKCA
jgi:hypothetical protein